jgi:hypothetical protein
VLEERFGIRFAGILIEDVVRRVTLYEEQEIEEAVEDQVKSFTVVEIPTKQF